MTPGVQSRLRRSALARNRSAWYRSRLSFSWRVDETYVRVKGRWKYLYRRLIRPTLGFQSMKTAYATIKGFEVMRMFKKGQFTTWIDAIGGGTEAHFINRLFGLYA